MPTSRSDELNHDMLVFWQLKLTVETKCRCLVSHPLNSDFISKHTDCLMKVMTQWALFTVLKTNETKMFFVLEQDIMVLFSINRFFPMSRAYKLHLKPMHWKQALAFLRLFPLHPDQTQPQLPILPHSLGSYPIPCTHTAPCCCSKLGLTCLDSLNGSPKSTDGESHLLWEGNFQLWKLPQLAAFSAAQYGAGTCSWESSPSFS